MRALAWALPTPCLPEALPIHGSRNVPALSFSGVNGRRVQWHRSTHISQAHLQRGSCRLRTVTRPTTRESVTLRYWSEGGEAWEELDGADLDTFAALLSLGLEEEEDDDVGQDVDPLGLLDEGDVRWLRSSSKNAATKPARATKAAGNVEDGVEVDDDVAIDPFASAELGRKVETEEDLEWIPGQDGDEAEKQRQGLAGDAKKMARRTSEAVVRPPAAPATGDAPLPDGGSVDQQRAGVQLASAQAAARAEAAAWKRVRAAEGQQQQRRGWTEKVTDLEEEEREAVEEPWATEDDPNLGDRMVWSPTLPSMERPLVVARSLRRAGASPRVDVPGEGVRGEGTRAEGGWCAPLPSAAGSVVPSPRWGEERSSQMTRATMVTAAMVLDEGSGAVEREAAVASASSSDLPGPRAAGDGSSSGSGGGGGGGGGAGSSSSTCTGPTSGAQGMRAITSRAFQGSRGRSGGGLGGTRDGAEGDRPLLEERDAAELAEAAELIRNHDGPEDSVRSGEVVAREEGIRERLNDSRAASAEGLAWQEWEPEGPSPAPGQDGDQWPPVSEGVGAEAAVDVSRGRAPAAGGAGGNDRQNDGKRQDEVMANRLGGSNPEGESYARATGDGGVEGATGLEGLTPDEVEERLVRAGLLHRDGEVLEAAEGDDDCGGGGVFNEVELSDGREACHLLVETLGFDEADIDYLRSKYAPLRGEPWYRREPTPGLKNGKKVLDVFFLEETIPELLDVLVGEEADGCFGLTQAQLRGMLLQTPALVGLEAADAEEVGRYLREAVGLTGRGELASALAACPPMLMYNARDNLMRKVQYYQEALSWSPEDVRSMLGAYPKFLSVKMENDGIEIVDYLRSDLGLPPMTTSIMIREYPEILEVRPKRLKAVVKYLWKVLEIPRSGVAALLSQNPRACSLEAEANLAPLRQFFERELFVEDTARIGRLVYKFPRLLFQDVETQLKPRAEEFRKALGLEGLEPLPPRERPRPKRSAFRSDASDRQRRGDAGPGRGRRGNDRPAPSRRGVGRGRGGYRGRGGRGGGRGRGRTG